MRQIQQIDLRQFERGRGRRRALGLVAAVAADAAPSPAPRDEAVFWLTAAAEVEHALMVQYLFAGYSLNPAAAGDRADDVAALKRDLLQIAREEMGHLITVQNLLILIGGPLNLGREHSPYASEIYPFRFKLERASLDSLAKYVIAECPDKPFAEIAGLTPEDVALEAEIKAAAKRSNDGEDVRHVGPIFSDHLTPLFETGLADGDFQLGRGGYQARWDDWGMEPPGNLALEVMVRTFDQGSATEAKAAAVAAIRAIGAQGEAADEGTVGGQECHFERFLAIYKRFRDVSAALGRDPVWPVGRDPNTSAPPPPPAPGHIVETVLAQRLDDGRITDPRSAGWARLFNLRYRLLLGYLLHTFLREEPIYDAAGDRTPRGHLQIWTFDEMRRVKKLAEKLVQMPLGGAAGANAGPPFELPYTLNLSTFEADRWRAHADVLAEARAVAEALLTGEDDAQDPFLQAIVAADAATGAIAAGMAATGQLNAPPPEGLMKVLTTLDESVRGFAVTANAHGAFWRGVGRDAFVATEILGDAVVVPGDAAGSPLLNRISRTAGGRMPRFRPRLPQARIDAVRDWIAAGAPDTPPGAILHGEPSPAPEAAPAAPPPTTGAPSFATDIRPLFRTFDRNAMMGFFDLHDHAQVSEWADTILERLEDGTMPCDSAWPPERIELFRRWRDGGMAA